MPISPFGNTLLIQWLLYVLSHWPGTYVQIRSCNFIYSMLITDHKWWWSAIVAPVFLSVPGFIYGGTCTNGTTGSSAVMVCASTKPLVISRYQFTLKRLEMATHVRTDSVSFKLVNNYAFWGSTLLDINWINYSNRPSDYSTYLLVKCH